MDRVLVDSTVWIDFFANKPTSEADELARLMEDEAGIHVCGVILTEVLQGIRLDEEYRRALSKFENFLWLPMDKPDYVRAADFHRSLRRKGITIRNTIDCIIASVAVGNGVSLLHNDRDFDALEAHCGLKVARIPKH